MGSEKGRGRILHYGEIKKFDIANGIGVRVSLFVSGCRNACPGCFNRDTWNFKYGKPFTKDTEKEIIDALAPSYVAGLTVLGGEPLEPENQPDILEFLKTVREKLPQKTIWLFTGFTLEELSEPDCRAKTPYLEELLRQIDVLIDGRFEEEKKNISLQFRGSENQRVIDLKATLQTGKITLWSDLRR